MNNLYKMKIVAIDNQGDRVLLYKDYSSRIPYYAIATPEEAIGLSVGDEIYEESVSVNAGLFRGRVIITEE